jgi:hypothetical protein
MHDLRKELARNVRAAHSKAILSEIIVAFCVKGKSPVWGIMPRFPAHRILLT